MLTSELLQVSVRKGVVHPRYIPTDDDELIHLADSLVRIFESHMGKSRGDLNAELKDYLGDGIEYILHRGLAKLLMDRCEFEVTAEIEPSELRREVFTKAAAYYRSDSFKQWDRQAVLDSLTELPLDSEGVERTLYADLKDEQELTKFRKLTGQKLLYRYNVGLAQAVLFKATELEVHIQNQPAARYRALFHKLKFFQLLHHVTGTADSGYEIIIDGPMSLFKSSQKYGLQMASFLPSLLHCDDFTLHAHILWGKQKTPREFRLSHETGLQPYTSLTGQWQPDEMKFLLTQFPKANTEWEISQEAELIDLGGKGVLVPDYVFVHPSGQKVVMEIFGFWRKGALQSRLELLKKHGPKNLILAVSKELATQKEDLDEVPGEVYIFRTTPIANELVKILHREWPTG